jgi:hypothetical protein
MRVFHRQRYLLDYTLSSLLRRKGKHVTLLTIYTLIIFLLAPVMLFAHALKGEVGHTLVASPEIVLQRTEAGRHGLNSANYTLLAFLSGYLLVYLYVFYTGAPLFESVLKGWSVLYPSFSLTPSVDGLQLATLFFVTVFPYVVSIIFPVWQVAITDPDAVMR